MDKDFAPKVPSLLLVGEKFEKIFSNCDHMIDFHPILQWNPPSLKDVAKDMVDCYFSRLPEAADIIARDIYAREIHPKNETELVKTLVSSRVVKSFRNRVVSAES